MMTSLSNFKPAWWLPGPHFQTLWPVLSGNKQQLDPVRQRLKLPDDDFIDIDWLHNSDAPIVIILHGLEGSVQSHYARGMLVACQKYGYSAVLMHFRGCSGEINRLPRGYHSGETGDIDFFIRYLRQQYPHRPLAAIGYSLGGNVLLKWLGEDPKSNRLDCAVAVSVPLCLDSAADRLQKGFSRIYQWYLINQLKQKILQKQAVMDLAIDVDIRTLVNFWQFDDKVTAPLHGFSSVKDYYRQASAKQYLPYITTPTLILHAKDDPFTTPAVIPHPTELSSQIIFELSEHGGHLGFIQANGQSWLLERIPHFLAQYL